MTRSPNDRERQPPRINGPAFLVFGIAFAGLGFATETWWLAVVGAGLAAVGVWGIRALRRFERDQGIADALPGAPPPRAADDDVAPPQTVDDDSASSGDSE